MVYEDYNIEKSVFEVILSYKIPKSKQLPADTPPVLIGNNRQFQSYLGQTKNDTVRLCVELKEKVLDEYEEEIIDDLGSSDLPKTKAVDVYGIVEENVENVDVFTHTDSVVERKKSEAVEDGEDDGSRFDYCDDSDGTDSDDENFSLYGIPPEEEDKTNVSSKKMSLSVYVEEDKGDATYETLELSSLGLAVGQCFETKDHLETRLKILTVLQKFDFDVSKSTPTLYFVKCWIKGCRWRVRATPVDEYPKFQVRVYVSEHTCSVTKRSSRSRQATHEILGLLYKNYVGGIGPKVLPMHVAEALTKRFQIKVRFPISWLSLFINYTLFSTN